MNPLSLLSFFATGWGKAAGAIAIVVAVYGYGVSKGYRWADGKHERAAALRLEEIKRKDAAIAEKSRQADEANRKTSDAERARDAAASKAIAAYVAKQPKACRAPLSAEDIKRLIEQ